MTKKILHIITYPLRKESILFAALCGVSILTILSTWYCGNKGIGTIIANVFLTYLLTALVSIMPKYLNTILRWLTIGYSVLTVLLVFFGALFIHNTAGMNTLMLILQTNTQEVHDFFQYYVHFKQIVITLAALALICGISYIVYEVCKSHSRLSTTFRILISFACISTVLPIAYLPANVLQTTPQLEPIFTNLDLVINHHDLRECVKLPQLEETRSIHPQNIVLILGESHHKSHCSLMGYDKPTNPLLQELVDSNNLVAFDSVTAPAAYTGFAILRIMSTYGSHMLPSEEGLDWWECQTIPTTFKAMGYTTIWLTNQKDGATRDAIADSYAKLCDVFQRTSGKYAFDGELLPMVKYAAQSNANNQAFYVVHLMGSHEAYDQRYPESFSYFKPQDYPNAPEHQRPTLAHYDNSLLYNDYIIHSIIQQFADQSTIVIYLPDHAIDLFMTDPDYAAHAKADAASQQVSLQIPMFIYLSDSYKQLDEGSIERLQRNRHKQLNTSNIIYSIMDLAGWGFKE